MARLIRFQERTPSRDDLDTHAERKKRKLEAEAEDWDEASQMVRHYLQLAETALKEELAPRKRKRA